jgi:hypothetical protein
VDWVSISALATAGGTLALAATTYGSVRSANRAARAAEHSLLAELRPLIIESFEADPTQRVNFHDVHGIAAPGGGAAVQVIEDKIFIVLSLRNVGPGIGVLHGGQVGTERPALGVQIEHNPIETFRMLSRDLYIPPGKFGYWQIAFRDVDDPEYAPLLQAIEDGWFSADLLYGDYDGGQRVISRYTVSREEDGEWRVATVRHWQIDRSDPR